MNIGKINKILTSHPTLPRSLTDLIFDILCDGENREYLRGVTQTLYLLGYVSQEERDVLRGDAE